MKNLLYSKQFCVFSYKVCLSTCQTYYFHLFGGWPLSSSFRAINTCRLIRQVDIFKICSKQFYYYYFIFYPRFSMSLFISRLIYVFLFLYSLLQPATNLKKLISENQIYWSCYSVKAQYLLQFKTAGTARNWQIFKIVTC